MKFEAYEREHFACYQSFAESVRVILESAIAMADGVPRPQSIQARAKTPTSLKKRLLETDQLDADVQVVRKDLAGVRIIFYTNTDVDRFLNSGLVFGNFSVDSASTKIHHPVEKGESLYRAIHYIITLNETRAALAEYQLFAGMRCEIQIQTILVHAWAETSHDIIYKTETTEGFGNVAMEAIRKRFSGIMDKYLLPAGYEFQRVQHDYERLKLGKELFDQNILESLAAATDNNDRYDLITSLKDDVLPHYDAVEGVFREIVELLVATVLKARITTTKPVITAFGEYPGRDPEEVTKAAIEILERHSHLDVERTYEALETLFAEETDERARKQILGVVEHIAGYNIRAWNQVGPAIQECLAEILERRTIVPSALRPIVITVWEKILNAEADDAIWSADSVSLQSREVPISAVADLRDRAISALLSLFKSSSDDKERRPVISALENAARTSYRGDPKSDFLKRTLEDQARVTQFYTAETSEISYELRETIEHSAIFAFYRALDIADDPQDRLECRLQAQAFITDMLAMRDAFNGDESYIRYKTLVGYESVFPQQWEDRNFEYEQIERYRNEKIEQFIDDLAADTQEEWLSFIERCASTKSNDLATFPKFGAFISILSEAKPEIADFFLDSASQGLLSFLPAFLGGLMKSGRHDIYERQRDRFVDAGQHLSSITRHWRISIPVDQKALLRLLSRSIESEDQIAVVECMLFAMENYPSAAVPALEDCFRPAIVHLTKIGDARWVNIAWFTGKELPFFAELSEVDANLLLENLLLAPDIDHRVEKVLALIAKRYLEKIWEYFGLRLENPQDRSSYRTAPYRFQRLAKDLLANPGLAIKHARDWYRKDSRLFRYRGGRILGITFPTMTHELSEGLVALVRDGNAEDADFVSEIIQSYHGEISTHDVLKALIIAAPDDECRTGRVSTSFDNTGVVHGEYGFVKALQNKKELIRPWLDDDRPAVVEFAAEHLRGLDLRIAQEQRHADEQIALRRLQYPPIDEQSGD